MEPTTVILVEDEPLFREMLRRILSAEESIKVIGETENGETAIQLAKKKNPDVVLMDIELSGELDGIDAAIQIKKERPRTGIVILSVHGDRRYVTSLPLDNSPGWAYLLKQTVPDVATILRAVEGTKAGMLVLDPTIMKDLRPKQGSILSRLTPRQLEVLELLAQGYSNVAIADRLTLAEKSIETYINTIYQELQLSHEPEIHARVRATLLYLQNSRKH